jgi:hypothetical protein
MAIQGIFVQWIKYVKVKGSTRAMHFYLTKEGKSTMSLEKAKKFKSKEDAVDAAKEFWGKKEWFVFQQTEFKSSTLAKSK